MTDIYRLLLGVLCTWRITHLLNAEDGPWNLVTKLRRAAGAGFGELLDCFYCLSLWVAAPFAWVLGDHLADRLLMWLAYSAGACLLERATNRRLCDAMPVLQAKYEEHEEVHEHDVLRTKTSDGIGAKPND